MKVIKSNNKEILRIIRNEYEQEKANKSDNLEKMAKFLETYHVPRLNHEEIKNLNRPTMNKEI